MAQQYEKVIIQHCVIPESLRELVEMDMPDDIFPEVMLRTIYRFAIDYWHADGGAVAPSPAAIRTHFANELNEHEIDLDIEPEDTLVWAIEAIRGSYIDRFWQKWVKDFVVEMGGSELLAKTDVMDGAIQQLMEVQARFTRRSEVVDVREAAPHHLLLYEARERMAGDRTIIGARFGLREIDEHTGGIRPGEIAVLAAPPKTGKSYELAHGAYEYWDAGGDPVLVTLENSVEMSMDRIACMRMGIDIKRWDEGRCHPEEVERVKAWIAEVTQCKRPFKIIQPEPGKRSVEQLVRMAKSMGDAIYLDQLTFVEGARGSERKSRPEQIRDMMHDLKSSIGSGHRIPCIAAHQINREGVEHAKTRGYLEMHHMAEGSEIERTADFVFGLWQNRPLRQAGRAWFQSLAARRKDLINWEIYWQPWRGIGGTFLAVDREVVLPDE